MSKTRGHSSASRSSRIRSPVGLMKKTGNANCYCIVFSEMTCNWPSASITSRRPYEFAVGVANLITVDEKRNTCIVVACLRL